MLQPLLGPALPLKKHLHSSLVPTVTSLCCSWHIPFLWGEFVSLKPNSQPGEPGYLSDTGDSASSYSSQDPLTMQAPPHQSRYATSGTTYDHPFKICTYYTSIITAPSHFTLHTVKTLESIQHRGISWPAMQLSGSLEGVIPGSEFK
jgi:hypothetical protein